jgi:hypothetical protein
VYSTEGAIADKSIAVTNNKAFFVSTDGIFTYDGTNVFKISDKLNETWKTLNKDALINSVAICKDSKYILAVPEGTSTVNNLIIEYDNTTGSFMLKRGKTVNSFVDFKDKILYTDESGKIFEYESGDMNNGNIIDSFWESGITDQGFPNSIKYSDYLYFTGSGNGDVRFVFKTERGSKEKVVTLTTDEILYKVKLKNKGRQLSLRIENINGSNYKIVSPTLMVEYDLD